MLILDNRARKMRKPPSMDGNLSCNLLKKDGVGIENPICPPISMRRKPGVNLTRIDKTDVTRDGSMSRAVIVGGLHPLFYDSYGKSLMDVFGKGMCNKCGMEELEIVKV
jgi:hypothetical protein